jgi:hypothetical protein
MSKAALFREKAEEALHRAGLAPTAALRDQYVMHAIEWHRLAQVQEDRERTLQRDAGLDSSSSNQRS